MVTALKGKLKNGTSVLDLTEYPDAFQKGHWIFDGHWNEEGSEAAADIMTDYIIQSGILPEENATKAAEPDN